MRIEKAAFGLVVAFGMGLAGIAHGTTLADLNGGQTLTVGSLTFSDFSITVTGAVDHNLADYQVLTLSDGFRIAAGIGVFGGQQGDVLVSYDVSAAPGSAVDGMRLAFNGAATGAGSGATVSEDLFAIPSGDPIASALVFKTGGGSSQKVDSVSFAPQTSFTVEKDIFVKAGSGTSSGDNDKDIEDRDDKDHGKGDKDKDKDKDRDRDRNLHHERDIDLRSGEVATISFVDQHFAVVPEPGSLVLLGSGLMGLLALGRKRNR